MFVVQGATGRPGHPGPAGSKGEKVYLLFSFSRDLHRLCNPFTFLCFGFCCCFVFSFLVVFNIECKCELDIYFQINFYLCLKCFPQTMP